MKNRDFHRQIILKNIQGSKRLYNVSTYVCIHKMLKKLNAYLNRLVGMYIH